MIRILKIDLQSVILNEIKYQETPEDKRNITQRIKHYMSQVLMYVCRVDTNYKNLSGRVQDLTNLLGQSYIKNKYSKFDLVLIAIRKIKTNKEEAFLNKNKELVNFAAVQLEENEDSEIKIVSLPEEIFLGAKTHNLNENKDVSEEGVNTDINRVSENAEELDENLSNLVESESESEKENDLVEDGSSLSKVFRSENQEISEYSSEQSSLKENRDNDTSNDDEIDNETSLDNLNTLNENENSPSSKDLNVSESNDLNSRVSENDEESSVSKSDEESEVSKSDEESRISENDDDSNVPENDEESSVSESDEVLSESESENPTLATEKIPLTSINPLQPSKWSKIKVLTGIQHLEIGKEKLNQGEYKSASVHFYMGATRMAAIAASIALFSEGAFYLMAYETAKIKVVVEKEMPLFGPEMNPYYEGPEELMQALRKLLKLGNGPIPIGELRGSNRIVGSAVQNLFKSFGVPDPYAKTR